MLWLRIGLVNNVLGTENIKMQWTIHAKNLYAQGKTDINNMFKTELGMCHFPKKTTPLTVYLMSVHCLIPMPSPELETVITFYSFLSLQCLLIYHILPT